MDVIVHFSESERMQLYFSDTTEKIRTEGDFPKYYFEPGTPVWVADTSKWQLLKGIVTSACFAQGRWRNIRYCYGKYSTVKSDVIFKTKSDALNYLELKFQKELPGQLNNKRVRIVLHVSEAKRKRLQLEWITQVADQMSKAGMFKEY